MRRSHRIEHVRFESVGLLERALDELGTAAPQALADPEAVERLHRCLARLEARTARATAALDASAAWEARGARSAAAW